MQDLGCFSSVCAMYNPIQEISTYHQVLNRRRSSDSYELYYCFRAISTIRCKARRLDLMKMIERDRFAFERMPDDLTVESRSRIRRTNNANDGSTRGILGILIGKFPIYFGSTRAECGDISIARY